MADLSRRHLLRAGTLAGLSLALPDLLRVQGAERGTFGRARSVIMLYLHGGHAQQETWDPKPDGPSPQRGEFGAIATSVPGARVSELLPRCARILHRLAVIRSMSHANANHVQASLSAMTGHSHPPSAEARGDFPPSATDFPPFGAVVSSLKKPGRLPPWVQVGPLMRRGNGTVLHGQSPGLLGPGHAPLPIDQGLLPAGVRVQAGSPAPELTVARLTGRRELLALLDARRRRLDTAQALDGYQRRAFGL